MAKRSRRASRANRPRAPRPRDALNVSLVTYPRNTGAIAGTMSHDVELAKAAVLYADHVDLISAQAHVLDHFARLQGTGLSGVVNLITELDDFTLRSIGMDDCAITPEVRSLLPTFAAALDDEDFRNVMPPFLTAIYQVFEPAVHQFQQFLEQVDSESGAGELKRSVKAGLLTVVPMPDAGNVAAAVVRAAAGSSSGAQAVGETVWAWAAKLIEVLEDPTKRVILDPAAVDIVRSLIDSGLLHVAPSAISRSRAAHLGAGFIGRLPAFPDAPFDELLDLRAELSGPLTRYRAAVVQMSRTLMASPFDHAITGEADDVWTERVAPALADLEDELTDHGLVRELSRRARADARVLVTTGSGLLIGLQSLGHLSTIISGAVAGTSAAAGILGLASNDSRDATGAAARGELFYLYRLGQVR